jgi:hypothetical protein
MLEVQEKAPRILWQCGSFDNVTFAYLYNTEFTGGVWMTNRVEELIMVRDVVVLGVTPEVQIWRSGV